MGNTNWKELAYTRLKGGISRTEVYLNYSESPSGAEVLSFLKKKPKGEDERLAFSVDETAVHNLAEFLEGEVLGSFTLELPEGFRWDYLLSDYENVSSSLKRQGVELYLSSILGNHHIGEPTPGMKSYLNRKIDEKSVIETFKEIHRELGFEKIIKIGESFPDSICLKDGKEVRVEFESRSINFKYHKHDPEKCEYIVCWFDDWADCPVNVVSLWEALIEMTDVKVSVNGELVMET